MVIARFCRKPACRRAEEIFKKIVTGEAGPEERDAFAAHLGTCRACAGKLGKALGVAEALKASLVTTADRFRRPPRLDLPERPSPPARVRRFTAILVDLSLFIVVGLGLLLLIGVSMLGYQSVAQDMERVRVFTTVHEVLLLTRKGSQIVREDRDATVEEVRRRLEAWVRERRTDRVLVDPWGTPYVLTLKNGVFSVRSCGPNRLDEHGAGDDVTERTETPALGRPRPVSGRPSR